MGGHQCGPRSCPPGPVAPGAEPAAVRRSLLPPWWTGSRSPVVLAGIAASGLATAAPVLAAPAWPQGGLRLLVVARLRKEAHGGPGPEQADQ